MSLKQLLRKKFIDPAQMTLDALFGDGADAAPQGSTVPKMPVPPGHRRIRFDNLSLDYRWIFRKINEQRERSVRRLQPPMEWRDGATIPYLGADITLRVSVESSIGVRFDEALRELHVSLPASASEQQLKDRVQGWLQGEARRLFAERLSLYAGQLGVSFKSFALSSATTQWGSCTADGRIRLNWRLMHFALPNIDYVVAHELSHLREMNHGPQFWATVQSVFPEFESARRALRDHEPEKLPLF